MGPLPGSRTSSRTTADATTSRHHACAAAKRSGPWVVISQRPAPADHALAAAHPARDGPRVVDGRQQVQQGAGVLDGDGAGHEGHGARRGRRGRDAHVGDQPRTCEDDGRDPCQPRQGPPRRRRDVRRRRREVRPDQRRAVAGPGPSLAARGRPGGRRPPRREHPRHRGGHRHEQRAVRRRRRPRRARRLLPRDARRRPPAPARTWGSPQRTPCACPSPTTASTP